MHSCLKRFFAVLAVAAHIGAPADESAANSEARRWLAYPDGLPKTANPLDFGIEAGRKALAGRADPASAEAWAERAPGLKKALAASLGLDPMPERTPLNARITGRTVREGYAIENLVYESVPGMFVTANVYIPKSASLPAPAVVVAAGHAVEYGKNHDLYQLGQLSLVKQGMIVLAYDPMGQGERRLPGFTHAMGYGSLLVGGTNEGMIVWDAIRAVDYLVTRDDVDASRIGLTGNSGGGELVFYAMPLDDRIRAGASFCFVCSYDLWLAEGGNHCICNHMPGLVRQMEQFEIIGLNAPRPFLAGNGTEDKIFPIAGTRETMRRAGKIYEMAGAADRIGSFEAPMPHGWSQPLREAGAGWLSRWLLEQGDGSPIPEVGIAADNPESPDLLALEGGIMPDGAETVVTLNRKRADALIAGYAPPPATAAEWESRAPRWREAIWEVMGGEPEPFTPSARVVNAFAWEGLRAEVLSIQVEEGMEIAALFARPESGGDAGGATLFAGVHDGKDKTLLAGDAASAAKLGPVLIIEPRGTGESAQNLNHVTSNGVMIGRPLFAQQLWDVLQAGRWLAARDGIDPARIALHGSGDGALLAVYAAALEPLFSEVEARDLLASYRYFLEDDQPQSISLCVPNILKVADIPQLIALASPARVAIDGMIGYGEVRHPLEVAQTELAYPIAVYGALGAPDQLTMK